MEQLKIKDILQMVDQIQKIGMKNADILELPIYIGNDDELNGIHCAWYCEGIDSNNAECEDITTMINENTGCHKLNGKGILIS